MSDTAQFEISPPDNDQASANLLVQHQPKGVLFSGSIERALFGLCSVLGLCALLLCVRQPEHSWAWITAGAFLPLVLLTLKLTPALAQAPRVLRSSLARSLVIAGTLVLLPLLLRLAEGVNAIDVDDVRRVVGVLLGGATVIVGSNLPEQLKPMAHKRLEPELARRILRFAGGGIMLAGGMYGATWLLAPLTSANLLASTGLAAATLFIGARSVLLARQRNR